MTQILTTDRLILRKPEPRDVPAMTAFYVSERASMAGGRVPRPAAWKNAAAILGHWQLRGYGLWAVTTGGDDQVLGLVGPYYPDGWPETEIGWVLFDGAEGNGYAFEAATAAVTHARDTLGWTQIVHYIAPANARSIALAERLGATLDPNARVPEASGALTLVYRQPEAIQ